VKDFSRADKDVRHHLSEGQKPYRAPDLLPDMSLRRRTSRLKASQARIHSLGASPAIRSPHLRSPLLTRRGAGGGFLPPLSRARGRGRGWGLYAIISTPE